MKLNPNAVLPQGADCARCGKGPCAYGKGGKVNTVSCIIPKTISRADQRMNELREIAEAGQ